MLTGKYIRDSVFLVEYVAFILTFRKTSHLSIGR
jgi:hypothetical protein